jgi:MFS family permease
VFCGVAVAAAVGLLPAVNHVLPIAFWMLVIGVGSGAMTLYFQITISEVSLAEERGSALALGGLGWSASHLSTPLMMGFLSDRYDIVTAFYFMRRWAFASAARPQVSPTLP